MDVAGERNRTSIPSALQTPNILNKHAVKIIKVEVFLEFEKKSCAMYMFNPLSWHKTNKDFIKLYYISQLMNTLWLVNLAGRILKR